MAAAVCVGWATAMAAVTPIDFNTDPAGSGLYVEPGDTSARWQSDTGVGNSGYLSICDARGSQRGILLFKDFEPGLVVKAFTFEFDLRVGGGTDQPADGFSLSFAANDDPLVRNIEDNNNGNGWAGTDDEPGGTGNAGLPEEGTTTGLAIGFDTWQSGLINGVRDIAGISIRVNNALVVQFPVPITPGNVFTPGMPNPDQPPLPYIYTNDNDHRNLPTNHVDYLESMTTGARGTNEFYNPTAPFTLSNPQVDYLTDPTGWFEWVKELTWERFKAEVLEDGKVKVFWKGVEITPAGGLQTTFAPIPGRIVLGGRTGGSWAVWHVDNITITTVPADNVIIGAPTGNPIGFSIPVIDSGPAVLDPLTIALKLNGVSVTPTSVTKNGITSTILFGDAAAPLAAGITNTVDLTVRDTRGLAATKDGQTFVVAPYVTLPAALAVTDVNTAETGFNVRMHFRPITDPIATTPLAGYEMDNTVARGEQQLFGMRGASILTPANTSFTTETVNYSFDVQADLISIAPAGAFVADTVNPGGPNDYPDTAAAGIDPALDTSNIAGELIAYIHFPAAGVYNLIFNSDDGFRTTCDVNPRELLNSVIISQADVGKGASDVNGIVYVPQAGYYPVRTVWFQGGGGANLEWSGNQISPTPTTRRLLGDSRTTDSLKVYRSRTGASPAAVTFLNPARNSGNPYLGEVAIDLELQDGASAVDPASISLKLNDAVVTPTVNKVGDRTRLTYDPPGTLAGGDYTNVITFTAGAQSYSGTNTFTVRSVQVIPASLALPASAVNKANAGFLVKTVQHGIQTRTAGATDYIGLNNSIYRAETQIHGLWGWPNVADLTAFTGPGGYFQEPVAINYNDTAGGNSGYYPDDTGVPGINGAAPARETGEDDYSQEVLTVLDILQPGIYAMNVNSDDNFAVYIGNPEEWKTLPVRVGMHGANYTSDAGRGNGGGINSGTTFYFEITAAGLYPFRLVWEQGGGGHNVEWSVREHSNSMLLGGKLVNDAAGVLAYQYPLATAGAPYVKSFSPARSGLDNAGSRNRAGADATVKAVLDQGLGNITEASVSLLVDGAAVTPTVTKVGSEVTVTYKPAAGFAAGSHTVALTFGDRTVNWTFGVGLPTTPTFWIEAADYNYGGGQTKPEASVMPYFGGAYAGLAGVAGTDYQQGTEPSNPFYRYPNTQGVPMSWANDRDRGSGEVVTNFRIGWVGGGHWWNYTRTFPSGTYNVYAALSVDPNGGHIFGNLQDVTGGASTTLGLFDATFDTAGGGTWGNNNLVPMKDVATTNTIVALELSGTKTLRFNAGNGDFDFLLFAPAATAAPEITDITVGAGGAITVTWTGGGTLQAAPSITGPWADVTGATSPYTFTPTEPMLFGRIRQ